VRTARRELTGWEATPLRLADAPTRLAAAFAPAPAAAPLAGPSFHRGEFTAHAGTDHLLRLDGWTRGLVWVNGELLGRYSAQTPTRTLYVPGPYLRDGANELVVLELHGAAAARARFVATPDLGPTEA
jgi:beta-galactosidase